MVFEQNDRPKLGLVSGFHEVRISDNLFRPAGIDVWILEQSGPEHVEQ